MFSETDVWISPIVIDLSVVFFVEEFFGVDLWEGIWVSFLGVQLIYGLFVLTFLKNITKANLKMTWLMLFKIRVVSFLRFFEAYNMKNAFLSECTATKLFIKTMQ